MLKNENKNALKHGAFSEAVLLPGEDPKEFEELLAALNDEWNPEGPSEKDKIKSVAMGMWRKLRRTRYLQKTLAAALVEDSEIERERQSDRDKLRNALNYVGSGVYDDDEFKVEELWKKLGPLWTHTIKKDLPRKNYDSESAWLTAIGTLIANSIVGGDRRQREKISIADELCREAFADREQSHEERIDAKIDKDLKQLGQLQTMKALGIGKRRAPAATEPPKVIEAVAIEVAETQPLPQTTSPAIQPADAEPQQQIDPPEVQAAGSEQQQQIDPPEVQAAGSEQRQQIDPPEVQAAGSEQQQQIDPPKLKAAESNWRNARL